MINNTHAVQYIPPGEFWITAAPNITDIAGAVAGTISRHKAAAAETIVVTIPIAMMANSVALQGAKVTSIEVDFETTIADLTSITAVLNKVTRGADLAVATVAAVTFTQTPTAALAKVFDQHKLVITPTVPFWTSNDSYYLLQLTCVCPATSVMDFLAAFVNYTFRM